MSILNIEPSKIYLFSQTSTYSFVESFDDLPSFLDKYQKEHVKYHSLSDAFLVVSIKQDGSSLMLKTDKYQNLTLEMLQDNFATPQQLKECRMADLYESRKDSCRKLDLYCNTNFYDTFCRLTENKF